MDEKEILKFWKENKIFEKSLDKKAPNGEFVFYDGPPFATGLPHYGSLLASIGKDIFGRYKTMRGYHVRRRWGWDCHGLPIENMIEKRLGLKAKKDIETMGVEKFNEQCRSAVLETIDGWKEYIDKVGRWVDFDNAYMTMNSGYMESVWWALKQMWDKGLIYEGRKVLMYCPHCETPLAKAEVAMDHSYKTITEEAVTVKFKVKNPKKYSLPKNTYLLAWTTTPWTLPGNVALAINKKLVYSCIEVTGINGEKENLILAKKRIDNIIKEPHKIIDDCDWKKISSIEYEPPYEIPALKNYHRVIEGDFVTAEDGTGVVHINPIHGEDDYNIGVKYDLPIIPLLDSSGHFNNEAPEFIRGFYLKKGEKYIKEDLEKRGLIFIKQAHTHSYPHCHRCETPLYYSALSSWFINIQKVKNRLIQLNEKINWQPEHLKHGRFLNILKDAPDWNISRNRYWASPLPIWKCQKCQKVELIGSVEELKNKTKKSGNKYFLMRHGQSESNVKNIVSSDLENSHKYPLTEKGKKQAADSAEKMIGRKIDFIFYSPFERTKETAFIVAKKIGLAEKKIISDKTLVEINTGTFDGKPKDDYDSYFLSVSENFTKATPEGENLNELKKRMGDFIYDIEKKYSDKNILIISHGYPIWMLYSSARGLNKKESAKIIEEKDDFINEGEFMELDFTPLAHDKNYTLDLHRPYIDEVELVCDNCGGQMKRTPEVLDGWFESGAMPFAEYHYPFESKTEFEKRFPGDFVAEYIAQTRTWFYYMHAIAGILFDNISFKNVVSTGNILAEDGSKMSKSKGNYTDPMLNMDNFGADALRYYLMASPVMRGEDVRFSDGELRETRNKVINILWNTFKFFDLYQKDYDGKADALKSENVLDQWIIAKLYELVKNVTENLEAYDTVKATRPIEGFVNDFSTWYVRCSRERVKLISTSNVDSEDKPASLADKQFALATMRYVLLEIAKTIAPIMPFVAEAIYKGSGGEKESVHLEEWPQNGKGQMADSEWLIKEMEEVRKIVSLGLEARASAGIKVRQPLTSFKIKNQKSKIKNNEELLKLIKDELNVKKVVFDEKISGEVELDTEITPELKEEGDLREFIRFIQEMRKKAKLKPDQKIYLQIETNATGEKFLQKFGRELMAQSGVGKLSFGKVEKGEEIKIDEIVFKVNLSV